MAYDAHPADLLAPYVVDACTAAEAMTVDRHVNRCRPCAAQLDHLSDVARLLGLTTSRTPAPALRRRVLAAALAARPARMPEVGQLLEPYVAQVTELGRLLAALSAPQWGLPAGKHPTVREMVGHLAANDGLVAADLGIRRPPSNQDAQRRWREQADALLLQIGGADARTLDRPVRLAGKAVLHRPLRDALTQRAFETWIHADDVRAALDLPPEQPPPEQLARIADFGLRLLPSALDAAARGRPGQALSLLLDGDRRVVPLSAVDAPVGVVAEVSLPLDRFCRLLAGRIPVDRAGAEISGDRAAADAFLAVAVTLGCD
jgi:uncharacterized protein (TIGR03083 family)